MPSRVEDRNLTALILTQISELFNEALDIGLERAAVNSPIDFDCVFDYIADNFNPDSIFSKDALDDWATENGYVSEISDEEFDRMAKDAGYVHMDTVDVLRDVLRIGEKNENN